MATPGVRAFNTFKVDHTFDIDTGEQYVNLTEDQVEYDDFEGGTILGDGSLDRIPETVGSGWYGYYDSNNTYDTNELTTNNISMRLDSDTVSSHMWDHRMNDTETWTVELDLAISAGAVGNYIIAFAPITDNAASEGSAPNEYPQIVLTHNESADDTIQWRESATATGISTVVGGNFSFVGQWSHLILGTKISVAGTEFVYSERNGTNGGITYGYKGNFTTTTYSAGFGPRLTFLVQFGAGSIWLDNIGFYGMLNSTMLNSTLWGNSTLIVSTLLSDMLPAIFLIGIMSGLLGAVAVIGKRF